MLPIIQILGIPFLACILMSSILGYLGIHVLKREVIFIDIALAQIAAVGYIAANMIFDQGDCLAAYLCSFGCVLLAAAFYAFVRSRISQISLEAVIGISYAIAAAAALLLVGIAPGGHIHIQHILSGSLLWTSRSQLVASLILFSVIGCGFYLIRKPMAAISGDYSKDASKNLSVIMWDFIFYLLLGIVITLSVRLAGIVVVFAYLIIPATISAVCSTKLKLCARLIITLAAAIAASLGGMLFAYYLDFSLGPSIALFLGVELIIIALVSKRLAKAVIFYKKLTFS